MHIIEAGSPGHPDHLDHLDYLDNLEHHDQPNNSDNPEFPTDQKIYKDLNAEFTLFTLSSFLKDLETPWKTICPK